MPGGEPGVEFGTPGAVGIGMDFFNQDILSRDVSDTNPVLVSLSSNDRNKSVAARTVGRHMLVGVRKWSVSHKEDGDECIFTVRTWAVEKARNLRNLAGAATPFGQTAQTQIWIQYLNNVVLPHRSSPCFSSGDNSAVLDSDQPINHNPYLR